MRKPSLPRRGAEHRKNALRIFGANVRRERVFRLISQEKLAALAALNVRTIARIEAGELNLRSETIDRVRRAIGCSVEKLL
jgi:transcriptional regulator with XRE-family HTH domain